ncbi:unnamed protein product [Rangifer tarandus platyrhynchus]|uniref:Uncharacterized protein n=1 Tax=Rangifer tarandus platyrhynchus TaxID=3082113 RepID=A0AC59ZUU3_RANTA
MAAELTGHDSRSLRALGPVLCDKTGHRDGKPHPATKDSPRSPQLDQSLCSNEDPAQPKVNVTYKKAFPGHKLWPEPSDSAVTKARSGSGGHAAAGVPEDATVTGPGHRLLLPSPHTRPAGSAHAILTAPFDVGLLTAPISQVKRPKHRQLLTRLRSPS